MYQRKNIFMKNLCKSIVFLFLASPNIVFAQDGSENKANNYESESSSSLLEENIAINNLYIPINPTEDEILGESIQPGDIEPPNEPSIAKVRSGNLNQEIIYNVEQGIYKRAEIKFDWRTYKLFPYKDLKGNDSNVPLGIVIHETANPKSTIWNEIAFMDNNWTSAFVHAFVDQGNIVEIHDPSYAAWGAGKVANQYFIHIELVEHPGNRTAFMKSVLNDAYYAAKKLQQFGLVPSRASGIYGNPTGTIWSHHEVSSYLGGTNHSDPTGYFKQFGYSMEEFFELIQYEYNQLAFDFNGNSGWKKLDNNEISFWENGQPVIGWKKIGGIYYLFDEFTKMKKGWQYIDNFWYYLSNENGKLQTGWKYINNNWYYLHTSGEMLTDWINLDTWYYLSEDGAMRKGWQYISNHWYYLDNSGKMSKNWLYDNQNWYFLNNDGAMRSGWQIINGKWYYFKNGGTMAKGWQLIDGCWYYLNNSGVMVTGWNYINGKNYYFYESGVMRY